MRERVYHKVYCSTCKYYRNRTSVLVRIVHALFPVFINDDEFIKLVNHECLLPHNWTSVEDKASEGYAWYSEPKRKRTQVMLPSVRNEHNDCQYFERERSYD